MGEILAQTKEAILADSQISEYRALNAQNKAIYERFLTSQSEADRHELGRTADQMLEIERALAQRYGVDALDIPGIIRNGKTEK